VITYRLLFFATPLLAFVSCMPGTHEVPPIHRKMFGLVENFDRFDGNGDGYLTRKELEKGVNSMGTERLTAQQYDQVMLVYDTNKDQKISLNEAQVAAEHGPVIFEN
jgi:hypothetical protein